MHSRRPIACVAGGLLALGATAIHAEDDPSRPVTGVVPSTPGSGSLSDLVFNAGLHESPKYERADFTTITMISANPYMLVARPDLPVNSY